MQNGSFWHYYKYERTQKANWYLVHSQIGCSLTLLIDRLIISHTTKKTHTKSQSCSLHFILSRPPFNQPSSNLKPLCFLRTAQNPLIPKKLIPSDVGWLAKTCQVQDLSWRQRAGRSPSLISYMLYDTWWQHLSSIWCYWKHSKLIILCPSLEKYVNMN